MKKGISLIVLVITIIVMIILAASVVITLSNTGVINRASQAVDATNESQVQDLAALIWADAYMDNKRGTDLVNEVTTKLGEQGVTADKWNITVTDTGVTVTNKNSSSTTLGSLIKGPEDYGKTVDYVSDNGVSKWKIFYKQNIGSEQFIYLIAESAIEKSKIPTELTSYNAYIGEGAAEISGTEYQNFGTISWEEGISVEARDISAEAKIRWMANWSNYSSGNNAKWITYFLDETIWKGFKNTNSSYSKYVKGAIGTPTAEMLVASWNEKSQAINEIAKYKKLELIENGTTGYYINDITHGNTSNTSSLVLYLEDSLYFWKPVKNSDIWLASPSAASGNNVITLDGELGVSYDRCDRLAYGVRPVVCISADIPAIVGTTTDFSLVK